MTFLEFFFALGLGKFREATVRELQELLQPGIDVRPSGRRGSFSGQELRHIGLGKRRPPSARSFCSSSNSFMRRLMVKREVQERRLVLTQIS
jgi:hypothetical protein